MTNVSIEYCNARLGSLRTCSGAEVLLGANERARKGRHYGASPRPIATEIQSWISASRSARAVPRFRYHMPWSRDEYSQHCRRHQCRIAQDVHVSSTSVHRLGAACVAGQSSTNSAKLIGASAMLIGSRSEFR